MLNRIVISCFISVGNNKGFSRGTDPVLLQIIEVTFYFYSLATTAILAKGIEPNDPSVNGRDKLKLHLLNPERTEPNAVARIQHLVSFNKG